LDETGRVPGRKIFPRNFVTLSLDDKPEILFHVKALYNFRATEEIEFDFQAGDIIAVTSTKFTDWWFGSLLDETRRVPGRKVFPRNYVTLCD